MEVHFDAKFQVVGGFISHYLLEKSRVCQQALDERNYHIFYMLCAGAPQHIRSKLRITKPDDYHYLRNGCTQYFCNADTARRLNRASISESQARKEPLHDPVLDDVEGFAVVEQVRLGWVSGWSRWSHSG